MKKSDHPHRSIILGFSTTGVLMISLFFLMTNSMKAMFQDIEFVVHENHTSIALVTDMRDIINKRQISIRNIYIYSDYFGRDKERLLFYSYALQFIEARDKLQQFIKNKKGKYEELEWVRHITEAIENDRFVLYFQQIFPYDTNFSDTIHGEVL